MEISYISYKIGWCKFMKRFLTVLLGVLLVFSITGCENNSKSDGTSSKIGILVDVNQFARITPETLVSTMGEPDTKENWNYQTSKGTFPVTTYFYGAGEYEFLVIDNSVVRMTIHSAKYNNKDAKSIKFTTEASILDMLNINSNDERIKKTVDTGAALRFSPVSDNVADVWCSLMDKENKTIDEIKITYNLNYFD